MSCGRIALDRAGLKVDRYFASENDEKAISVSQHNFPDIIHIGDVTKISFRTLPKIDLLIGGSPCQGFSFSGQRLNFKDPRSRLFFNYLEALNELNPKYFLLENVKMKKEHQDVISSFLGVFPKKINSSLVSAQSRERLYWTNIPHISPIEDQNIVIKDILDTNVDKSLFLNYALGKYEKGRFLPVQSDVDAEHLLIPLDKHNSKTGLVCEGGLTKPYHTLWLDNGKLLQRNFNQGSRVYSENGKSPTLNANSGGLGGKTGLFMIGNSIRKLTVAECERLQTVPKGYTNIVSRNQAIKMLGNGWTVDIISHILRHIK
jgi:DNA (cytosine-5)-methyltransferase 3A